MKRIPLSLLLGLLLLTPSCISFRLSAEDDPSIRASGIGTAYAGYSGFDKWDGTIIKLGLFGGEGRSGEFFSLDIWPLGGVGLGVAGARVRVLPFEVGAGALLYHPRLPKKPQPEIVDDIDEDKEIQEDEKEPDKVDVEKVDVEKQSEVEAKEKNEPKPKKGK